MPGEAARIDSHRSAPDSPARNRSTSATSGRRLAVRCSASSGRARRQAALDPGLLAEQQPKAPLHDVVVVDDEHAQLAPGRGRRCARSCWPPGPAARRGAPASRPRPRDRTRPRRRAGGPRRRPGAGPCRRRAGPRSCPSLRDLEGEGVLVARHGHAHAGGLARAWPRCAAPRRAPTGPAARGRAARSVPRATAARSGTAQRRRRPLELGRQRGRRSRAAPGPAGARAPRRRSPIASCISIAAALAPGAIQGLLGAQRQRDPEQPLQHPLMDLARELEPLAEAARALLLAGGVARGGHERGGLAQRPEQMALAVGELKAPARRDRRR